jgi:hypothetical protein
MSIWRYRSLMDSSHGVETSYGLYDWEIWSSTPGRGKGTIFCPKCADYLWGPSILLCNAVSEVLSLAVKFLRRETGHSHLSLLQNHTPSWLPNKTQWQLYCTIYLTNSLKKTHPECYFVKVIVNHLTYTWDYFENPLRYLGILTLRMNILLASWVYQLISSAISLTSGGPNSCNVATLSSNPAAWIAMRLLAHC